MIESFLKYLQFEKRYSPKTISSYQTDLHQFEQFINQNQLGATATASHSNIRSWIVCLVESKIEAASVNRKIACLRSYYKFLLRQEIIGKDPMTKVRVLKTKRKLPHFVKENDMNQLLDQVDFPKNHEGLRDRLILELFYGTGIRLAELINLKESHVHLKDQTIRVLGKRNKERVIPFARGIVSIMEEYRTKRNSEVGKHDHGFFFVTDTGHPLYPMLVQRTVKKYLKLFSQVEKKSPHVLRHSYATHLLNKGAEINAVKDLLGHSSLAATQVYTHNSLEKIKKAFDQAHPKA